MTYPLYALRSWRERRAERLEDLAERAGVSVPTLKRLEAGKLPAPTTFRRLAAALEVAPHVLTHEGPDFPERDPLYCVTCRVIAIVEAMANPSDQDAEDAVLASLCAKDAWYPPTIPTSVPADDVLVHNHVRPARRQGTRGFRFWLQSSIYADVPVELCECGWAPELPRHYRVKLLEFPKRER